MKKLSLRTPAFEYLEQGYREWLDILGYCAQSVEHMPNCVREFFHFLEGQEVKSIGAIRQEHFRGYYRYLQSRPNQRRGGGLSDKYILMQMQAVEKLLEYLHHRGMENVPSLGVRLSQPQRSEPAVLLPEEVRVLFEAAAGAGGSAKEEAFCARDRAMLVVYYSCGLRRNEGVHLNTGDISFDSGIVHVRRGKNYKERFVPINKANAGYLQEYIYDHRPVLAGKGTGIQGRLFLSAKGEAMTGGALYTRLKLLQGKTDHPGLQEKTIGLHTLRHSIATHLLGAGMSLERIAKFLGHATMDSTQIYTHIVEKAEKAEKGEQG